MPKPCRALATLSLVLHLQPHVDSQFTCRTKTNLCGHYLLRLLTLRQYSIIDTPHHLIKNYCLQRAFLNKASQLKSKKDLRLNDIPAILAYGIFEWSMCMPPSKGVSQCADRVLNLINTTALLEKKTSLFRAADKPAGHRCL